MMFATIMGLLLSVGGGFRAEVAAAAASPILSRGSADVTADGLPTVQINGIIWTQVVVGNTVYAGGTFDAARPAGNAEGENAVRRTNLLAFDIRTGELIGRFAPNINGTVRTLAVSPDKKTLYIGGAFTRVNGEKRLRFAALSVGSGALKSMSPAFDNQVRTILPTSATVYVGGAFRKVGSTVRSRLAALNAKNGKLRSWKPVVNGDVLASTLAPDQKSIVIGGSFSTIGRTKACGMSRLSRGTGAVLPWSINTVVKNCGKGTAILSLTSDSSRVYGTGFNYHGKGNYEGVFAATGDGRVAWLQACRGDTYDVAVSRGRVYSVGHAHNCADIGGFPDASPLQYYRALAVTTAATGTVGNSVKGSGPFKGKPSPSLINWFPDLRPGNVTGLTQSAWSVVASGPYVVLGGEFTAVNGVPQQGLVRMIAGAGAPRAEGPLGVTASEFDPDLALNEDRSVVVSWKTAWDRDDQVLTYVVLRDNVEIARFVEASWFWRRKALSMRDQGVQPGLMHKWRIRVVDADGNGVTSSYTRLVIPPAESPSPLPVQPSPSSSVQPRPEATPVPTGTLALPGS